VNPQVGAWENRRQTGNIPVKRQSAINRQCAHRGDFVPETWFGLWLLKNSLFKKAAKIRSRQEPYKRFVGAA
jgi:hypothetical protein